MMQKAKVSHSFRVQWPNSGYDTVFRILEKSLYHTLQPHAYLFYGGNGVGKRSIVEAYTRVLLCTSDVERPCGTCVSCTLVANNTYPDFHVVEPIDGVIGIEDIRVLSRSLHRRAMTGGMTVAVIVSAEALSSVAANALLKILEEPPAQTVLMLTAHSLHSVAPTLRSRCQIIRCAPMSHAAIDRLLNEEGYASAIRASIVSAAFGNIGTARALAVDDGSIYKRDLDSVLRFFEGTGFDRIATLVKATRGVSDDDALHDDENDMTQPNALRRYEEILRDMLLLRLGVDHIAHKMYRERIERLSEKTTAERLLRAIELIAELRTRLATHAHQQLAWENFFIKADMYV